MYCLANDPASNTSWWVDTGLERMLMPGVTLLWLGMLGWAGSWLAEKMKHSTGLRQENVETS